MQWLYIFFVFVTLAIGIMMARAVFLVIKGRQNAYRYSIISLVAAVIVPFCGLPPSSKASY